MGRRAYCLVDQDYLAPYRNDDDFPVMMRVFLLILSKTNYANGVAYITASDIIEGLGAHRSQVDLAISFLTRKGLISKVNGKGRSKHFRLACWRMPNSKKVKE